jgi:MSHA biogenesis protein MshN
MSLINKMLQDLDARGGGGGDAAAQSQEVKAVPAMERDRRPLLVGGAALGVLVLAAAGWYGWQYWQTHSAPPPGPAPRIVDNRAPNKPRLQEPPAATQPSAASAPATPGEAVTANEATQAAHIDTPANSAHIDAPTKATRAAVHADAAEGAEGTGRVAARPKRIAEGARDEARGVGAGADAGAPVGIAGPATTAIAAAPAARKPARAAAEPHAAPADGVVLRELTPKQMSENSYRRGLAALQEGRVSAALADLDRAVEIDPRNDAARQTYVSLLLENRRTDDAIRQLRLALGIEPRQPGLAMVLARLQLEKGGPALDTLLKTLPYAVNNADYQAFVAGVLQREQRHAEAAEHYRNALAIAPGNAVWWMGLGISLQADQHLPEAREAYRQARNGAGLTPELKAFIDRKLDQLAR